jgi:hypothetical protein
LQQCPDELLGDSASTFNDCACTNVVNCCPNNTSKTNTWVNVECPVLRCDSASLRFMLRELAARWVTLMKPPSSDTSLPSDSSL